MDYRDLLRLGKHAATLGWAELRGGRNSLRRTVDLIRGRSGETADSSTPPRTAAPAPVAGRSEDDAAPPTRLGRILALLALGLLRRGHVHDAAEVIGFAKEQRPEDRRVLAVAAEIEGERRVLDGEWTPAIDHQRVEGRPDHVLHVVGKSLPDVQAGFTIRTDSIVRSQRAAGLAPAVASGLGFPEGSGAAPRVDDVGGVPHYRLGGEPVSLDWAERLDATLAALLAVIEDFRPAVLHAHSDFQNGLVAVAAGRITGLPVIYEARGFWEETWLSTEPGRTTDADRYRLRRQRETEAMEGADIVITLSGIMRELIIERGLPAEKVRLVPNAVDPDRFPDLPRDDDLRRTLGVAPDAVLVASISTLKPYEGHLDLVDAVGILRERGLPVELLIAGSGAMESAIRARVHERALDAAVHVLGQIPSRDIARHYAAADVVAIPRSGDRVSRLVTPLKPFEALSAGRPLVVSKVPPLVEIARSSGAGLVANADDPDSLAGVIGDLALNAELRAALGAAGARWVRAECLWSQNAERYRRIYAELGAAS